MTPDLNLNKLRAFYCAASCGSVTVAAEKLCITQPAVSMQIKSLEKHYEVQLFVRGKKKLELTEAGKSLYRLAKEIFALAGEAERLLKQAGGLETQVLKVGSTKTLVRYVLAKYISLFQRSFPGIQIQIDEGSSWEMVQSVLHNDNDLAIVGRIAYPDQLQVIPFTQDEVVLLAAPGHRLCQKEEVSIDDLRGETVLLREKGSGTRWLVERILNRTSIVSSAWIESGNVDFIKEMVRIGNGITLLAQMGVEEDVNKGNLKVIRFKEGRFILYCDIVINRQRPLSKADRAFLNVLIEGKSDPLGNNYQPAFNLASEPRRALALRTIPGAGFER